MQMRQYILKIALLFDCRINNRCKLKRWWFLFPLPVAMLLTCVLVWLKFTLFSGAVTNEGFLSMLSLLCCIAFWGAISFPVGLPLFCLRGNNEPLSNIFLPVVLLGYAFYVGLSIYGTLWRSRIVLVVLCILLLINIIGCQFDGAAGLIPIGRTV